MQIEIQSPQFPMTTALNGFVRRQINDRLASCAERVRSVQAHMSDVNGQRGGNDKRCRLVVHLRRAPAVVVESVDADLYRAVRRGVYRLARAVNRRNGKRVFARRRSAAAADVAEMPATGDRNEHADDNGVPK